LVKVYRQCLNEHGHFLGILLTIDNPDGPPFGCTEWEYRERLKKSFHLLYWTKWHGETTRVAGSELIVYGKKL